MQHTIEKRNIAIHALCWGLIIFIPAILRPAEDVEERALHTLRALGPTLCYMWMFYINYMLLLPRLYFKHRRTRYFVENVILIVFTLGLYSAWWWMMSIVLPDMPRLGPSSPVIAAMWQVILFSLMAALAMAIRMSQYWKYNDDLRREAEKAKSEAELSNLRSQLNPHFLLNTLNNIYALISIDPEKAQCAVHDLSKMLRHMLYDNQHDFVPLNKEVAFIKNYIELMKIRMGQNVIITTQISTVEKSATPIAPLLFISLVENAFKHGISPSEPSYIHIKITEEQGVITCEIRNSCHPKNHNDKSGSGIGLEQVQKRLSLMYKDRHEWSRGTTSNGNEYFSIIKLKSNDTEMRNS
ncbi:MAG: sensor histidine kinase [Bacteroidales bacterium]|nr:sensor histidine kinase [Bacteroidales bacterium]